MSSVGSISGSVNFSGLGSDTDTSAIVDKLVELESYQINLMESWKTEWKDKITSIDGLSTQVQALYDVANVFNEDFEFYARSSSSSNTSVASVTNTPYAKPGAHSLVVASTTQHRLASRGFTSAGTVVGGVSAMALTIMVGSTAVALSYGSNYAAGQWDSNATLQNLVSAIDFADAAAGDVLNAVEIVDDGTASNAKRLLLTAKTGGTSQLISVASDPTNLGLDGSWTVDPTVELASGFMGTAALTPTSYGMYAGYTNKRFTFEVTQGGAVSNTTVLINWSDGEGHNGTLTVSATGDYAVYQGVSIHIDSGVLADGDAFALDCYNPTLQAAQDNGLAQVAQVTHTGFIDAGSTAITTSAGYFSYTYAGVNYTVSVASGATLNDLVWAINNASGNPGVEASVFDDGTGLANSVHLRLTGENTGAAYQISDIHLTNITNFTADFSTTKQAQNAMFKLDGYPADSAVYMQRTSNLISDMITGVSITLKSSGSTTISVETDTDTIAQRIEAFVNQVNDVLEYINEETKYDAETGESGIMLGNYAFNLVEQRLKDIMTSPIPGLSSTTDTYVMLAQIGITSDPDNNGLFKVDSDKLDAALKTNLDAVARLFMNDPTRTYTSGGSTLNVQGVVGQLKDETTRLTDTTTGPMNVLVDNYNGIIDGIDDKIAREEDRVALVKSRLKERYSRLESTLSLLNNKKTTLTSLIAQLSGSSSSSSSSSKSSSSSD